MKTGLRLVPFMVCLGLVPARAADEDTASMLVDKNATASDAVSELPQSTDPLIDPLTGTPYIAVHNPDIVESAIFMIEFKRAHPLEHTLFLTAEIHDAVANTVDPAVAYTWKGKVYFHSYGIGDVLVPYSPEQVSEGYMSRLHQSYITLVRYYFSKSCKIHHIPWPMSDDQAYQLGQADKFPHVLPNELPGDTEDIQAKRVEARLKKLGLTTAKALFNISRKDNYGKTYTVDVVTFGFGNFEYRWSKTGCSYIGFARKTYLPGMLDSIIFSIDYQKANPSEKVFCFLHEASGNEHAPGLMVSTTVFTKNGRLWFHHQSPGDLPSALSLDDLKDSDRVIAADLEVFTPAIKKFGKEEAGLRHQPPSGLKQYLHGYKAPDLSVTGVLAELQKRGVEAKIVTGSDSPEVIFIWGSKPFTYKPELGCFAANPVPTTASN
jgi:hypothetical protein